MKRIGFVLSAVVVCAVLAAAVTISCSSNNASTSSSTSTSTRAVNANLTTVTSVTSPYGGTCTKTTRDTSSCQSARTALSLSGDWLSFSCNVVLGLATSSFASTTNYASATYVSVTFTGVPDHTSNYYPTSGSYSFSANSYTVTGTYSSMYSAYTTSYPNPNTLSQQSYIMYIPISPTSATHASMGMGVVGVAIDGTPIYNSLAASTDNIYAEAGSFDQCQGHPDSSSKYHYHSEPYPISYQDSNLVGVMRDGYFVYGRYDYGGSSDIDVSNTGSDAYIYGGHVGTAPSTGTGSRFHYHATKGYGCYHRNGSTIYADDGNVTVDGTSPCTGPTAGGTIVTAYFLTGHGNGGTFLSVPTATDNGGTMRNPTAAQRYYYGSAAGSCTGC